MAKEHPVGVAQKIVLDILGETSEYWSGANAIFERYGIVVGSKRQGRTSVPQVWERETDQGGWNPGHEDGYSGSPAPSRLTPEQRAALAPYWVEVTRR